MLFDAKTKAEIKKSLGLAADADDDVLIRTFVAAVRSTSPDARRELSELAKKLATEKGIQFTEALAQIKIERQDLVEEVANIYGRTA